MKRFHIVTEADARVLEYGSTIVLATGGHITPLAHDTLKARRITVVADAPDVDVASLAPVAAIKTVAIAGDHTSLALKAALIQYLRGRGLAAHDLGTTTTDAVDYPDTAAAVAVQVARGEADAGIVIDGAGLGSCGNVSQRDACALRAPAQRRQRARARFHAGVAGRGTGDYRRVPRHADA